MKKGNRKIFSSKYSKKEHDLLPQCKIGWENLSEEIDNIYKRINNISKSLWGLVIAYRKYKSSPMSWAEKEELADYLNISLPEVQDKAV